MKKITVPTTPKPKFIGRIPAHWNISHTDAGVIAYNVQSKEKFEGTLADFLERIK